MHLSERAIQSYVDQELSADEQATTELHLKECSACAAAFQAAEKRKNSNHARLDVLQPSELPDATSLRARLQSDDWSKTRPVWWRPAYAAAALAIVALLAAFTIKPVRVWATEFLSLFRVQQIAVVRVDPANLERLEKNLFNSEGERRIEQLLSENARVIKRGERKSATSANEAARFSGFGVRLPPNFQNSRLEVHPGIDISFSIDVERLESLFELSGATSIHLPQELDGQLIEVRIPSSVTAWFGQCPEPDKTEDQKRDARRRYPNCKVLVQLPAPSVVAPPALNVAQLGVEMLKFFGFDEAQATQFSETVDWTSTLVIPLPDGRINVTEVSADGTKASLFVSRPRGESQTRAYNLVWIRDGILYSLMGQGDTKEALAIANSM